MGTWTKQVAVVLVYIGTVGRRGLWEGRKEGECGESTDVRELHTQILLML